MTSDQWWYPFIQKITSARFWMVLLVTITLCAAVLKCFDLILSVIKIQDEKVMTFVKEIIMFVLGAFVSVVSAITTLYFSREDRKEPNGTEDEIELTKLKLDLTKLQKGG